MYFALFRKTFLYVWIFNKVFVVYVGSIFKIDHCYTIHFTIFHMRVAWIWWFSIPLMLSPKQWGLVFKYLRWTVHVHKVKRWQRGLDNFPKYLSRNMWQNVCFLKITLAIAVALMKSNVTDLSVQGLIRIQVFKKKFFNNPYKN